MEPAARTTRRGLVLAVLCLCSFLVNMDTTIVNVTLPTLVRELNATTRDLQWIVDAYNLTFAAFVLAAGSLGDRWGRQGMLMAGLGVYAAANGISALAGDPTQLIAARTVTGLAAAMIFPTTLSIITNVFPERGARARAIGIWGATTGLAVALGPIVGGGLLEIFSWQSTFLVKVPVALAALLLVFAFVPTSRDETRPALDLPGLALSTLGVGLLVYTIIEAPNAGWGSARTLGGFAGALLLLAAFVARERSTTHPMLDVRLFRNLRFSGASVAVTFAFFGLFGFIFLITQYFQFLKGYGPFETGVRIIPVAAMVVVGSVLGTRLAVSRGNKLVVASGLGLLSFAFAWIAATADASTPYTEIAAQMIPLGLGMGLTSAPATESIMGAVNRDKAGIGSAVNDTTRELGGTLGVAVIGSVYASLYVDALVKLPAVPARVATAAHDSIGGALIASHKLAAAGQPALARTVHDVASSGFFDGMHAGCLVAAGVCAAGAVFAALVLPARPAEEPVPATT